MGFVARWHEAAVSGASGDLEELLRGLYTQFVRPRLQLAELREALLRVLEFLTSSDGRTHANCATVDAFVCLLTAERDDLLDRLPEDYRTLLDTMSLDLHETLQDPERASQSEATPELLLEQARGLGVRS